MDFVYTARIPALAGRTVAHMTMIDPALRLLDRHYAEQLGCRPRDLRCGHLAVVAAERRDLRFAKGYPLPLFGMDTGEGTVVSVSKNLIASATAALPRGASNLDEGICDVLERKLTPLIHEGEWFRGQRLYLDSLSFCDLESGTTACVTTADPHAIKLHARWGGDLFAQIVEGRAVCHVVIKPLSDIVWDLGVETQPEFRGRGYARSAASAALKAVFAAGKLAAWGTDRDNIPSLKTAYALGFRPYGRELGCWLPKPLTPPGDGG